MSELALQNEDHLPTDMPVDPPGVPEGLSGRLRVSADHIVAGETVTIDWTATPISGYRFQLNGTDVPTRGSFSFRPLGDTTYTLTATRARSRISLAHRTVTVDISGCTLPGLELTEVALRVFLPPFLLNALSEDQNVEFSRGLFTVHAWLASANDVVTAIEADTGLVRVEVPLHLTIRGLPGEAMTHVTTWFAPRAIGGVVYGMMTRTQADLSPSPELLAAIVFLGPEAELVGSLLSAAGPSIAADAARGPLGAIGSLFQRLGDRVIAVQFVRDERDEPVITTTVCP